jgi:hypothetical protein
MKDILPVGVISVVQLLLLGGQLLANRDQSPGRLFKLSLGEQRVKKKQCQCQQVRVFFDD